MRNLIRNVLVFDFPRVRSTTIHLIICSLFLCLLLFIGCGSSDSSWQSFGRTADNNRAVPENVGPKTDDIVLKWKAPVYGDVLSSPVLYDGKLYVGSKSKKLYCFDSISGIPVWEFEAQSNINTAPVIYNDSIILSTLDTVFSINKDTGKIIWNQKARFHYYSSPNICGEKVFVGLCGKVICMKAENGVIIWEFQSKGDFNSSPAIYNEKVYIACDDGNFYCLNASDGKPIWTHKTGKSKDKAEYELKSILSSPCIYNDRVYFGADDGKLHCLDAETGRELWEFESGGEIKSTPTAWEDNIFFSSLDENLYCLSATTGNKKWIYKTSGAIYSSPVISGNRLFFGAKNGKIICLSAEKGEALWEFQTEGEIYSSPIVANEQIYIGSNDRMLYCFCDKGKESQKDNIEVAKEDNKPRKLQSLDWPQSSGTADNNSVIPAEYGPKSNKLGLVWKKTVYADIYSSPVALNGKIFVTSSNKRLTCFDSNNGKILWEFKALTDIAGSPVANGDKVFVRSFDELYCLNANSGAVVWKIFAGGESYASLVCFEGRIFFTNTEDLYCVTAENGKHLWQFKSEYTIFTECTIAEGKVYLASRQSDDGKSIVYCLSFADGKKIWQFDCENVRSSPIYYKSNIFFGAEFDYDDFLFCLSAQTGAKKWSYETSCMIISKPALYENKAYYGCENNKLYCLSIKDRKLIWEINTTGNIQFSPTICGNKVYFISDEGKLNCVSATDGKTLSYFSVIGGISSPIIISNGKIYFGSNYRYLNCIGDNGSADKKVEEPDLGYIFTNCGWPMYNRSNNGNKSVPDDCGPKSSKLLQEWEYNALKEFSYAGSYDDSQPIIANGKFYLYYPNDLSYDKIDCLDINTGKVTESYGNIPGYPEIIAKDRFFGVYGNKVFCYSFERKDILWESEKFWVGYLSGIKSFLWNNLIYYQSDSSLFCISPVTGATIYELEKVSSGGPLDSSIILDDKIYLKNSAGCRGCDYYGSIYCYSLKTGDKLWLTDLKKDSFSDLIGYDGKVFVSTENEILCLDGNTGKNLWSSKIDNGCTPVLHNGNLYTLSSDKLICLDASTGKTIKEFNVKGNDLSISNNMAFVTAKNVSDKDKVLCVSLETGEITWKYSAKTDSINSITLIADRKIFFIDGQTIKCFGDTAY